MLTSRSCMALLGAVVLSLGLAGDVVGQITGRARIRQESYRVKIISNYGIPVTVGIFGQAKDATFRLNFDGGRTGPDVYTQNLIAGERVVCVWDEHGTLLFIANLTIDANGTLEIPDSAEYGAPARKDSEPRAGAPAAARSARPDLPSLKIKP